ncbi:hypothetical protein M413DRAFT_99303 [Hebeloma cylindrosporum]|uniref:Uncharacterized protein n=1 Tax=Hebeloma cylindrosporum TaxID=76867 RepID=A0A0C3CYF7_HEBCY|nr:hypothetical protein M413DRAFT_99303 [Hebeloma cylindrosporum h7]
MVVDNRCGVMAYVLRLWSTRDQGWSRRSYLSTDQWCVAVSFKIKMSYIQMSWACRDDHRETTLFLISKTTLESISRKRERQIHKMNPM